LRSGSDSGGGGGCSSSSSRSSSSSIDLTGYQQDLTGLGYSTVASYLFFKMACYILCSTKSRNLNRQVKRL
jgi:hypothetical protein